METLDVFFNSQFVGMLEAKEDATKENLMKPAETYFPRRSFMVRKVIFLPHKSISFFEKTD